MLVTPFPRKKILDRIVNGKNNLKTSKRELVYHSLFSTMNVTD